MPWVQALAIAGASLGLILSFAHALKTSHGAVRQTTSLSHLKQIGKALQIYASDYSELLPPAEAWMDRTAPYLKNSADIFEHPARRDLHLAFGFNKNLAGAALDQVQPASRTPMVLEVPLKLSPNALATPENAASNDGKYLVCFVDGSVKMMDPAAFRMVTWKR